MVKKETGARLSPDARKILLYEERYAQGDAFFRRWKKGLFTFTMMMKTVSMTKSLVIEIRTFCCMRPKQHESYQPAASAKSPAPAKVRKGSTVNGLVFRLLAEGE